MTQLKMLSADDKLAEIRRLYFAASKHSIQQDLVPPKLKMVPVNPGP